MQFVNYSVEYIPQGEGLTGMLKHIEIAGRTCYFSGDKITDESYKRFVDRMKESGHLAMLEHGTVYLYLEVNPENEFKDFEYPLAEFSAHYNWSDVVDSISARYCGNNYSMVNTRVESSKNGDFVTIVRKVYITTNYRVIIENGWEDDLQFMCEPTDFHAKRITFRFNTQIALTREINRHRVNSMAERSTRFCNFSKGKFGSQIQISIPHFTDSEEIDNELHGGNWTKTVCGIHEDYLNDSKLVNFTALEYWLAANEFCEWIYMMLLETGMPPEDARTILPLDLNSELVHTAFVSDWEHFIALRSEITPGNKPHPDIIPLAQKLNDVLNQMCRL